MKIKILVTILIMLILGCSSTRINNTDSSEFKALVDQYFSQSWKLHPAYATSIGNNRYDHLLIAPTAEHRDAQLSFYQRYQKIFTDLNETKLSKSEVIDKRLIEYSLQSSIWYLVKLKQYEWAPNKYNIGHSFSYVMQSRAKNLEDRLRSVSKQLDSVEEYYQAAKQNLSRPTQEHTQRAVKENQGALKYLDGEILSNVKKSKLLDSEKKHFLTKLSVAKKSISKYIEYLNKILKNPKLVGGFRSFRIGRQLYQEKFNLDLRTNFTPAEAIEKARTEKRITLKKMRKIARRLHAKLFPGEKAPGNGLRLTQKVINKLASTHTSAKQFVDTVRQQIPRLEKFVLERDLVTLDRSRPLKVRETPIYMRGQFGASIDSPGPFEPKRETYYNVSPIDDWTKEQQNSYLREYNNYTLQILNIHEAVPGHYVQLIYSNKSPSFVRSVLQNGTMIEGWAVYSERMMLEQGYGGNSDELWLMYYKWYLRVVTNMILDYRIHNEQLSQKQAMKLMVNEAFQEKTEAEKKWIRATVSQVQLASYFTGFSEIYDFRNQQKEQLGASFKLKKFHEDFLSYGSAPIGVIRELMSKSPN